MFENRIIVETRDSDIGNCMDLMQIILIVNQYDGNGLHIYGSLLLDFISWFYSMRIMMAFIEAMRMVYTFVYTSYVSSHFHCESESDI